MYIPEFWCGVIACIGVEFIALIIYSLYINMKGKENGSNDINSGDKPSKR